MKQTAWIALLDVWVNGRLWYCNVILDDERTWETYLYIFKTWHIYLDVLTLITLVFRDGVSFSISSLGIEVNFPDDLLYGTPNRIKEKRAKDQRFSNTCVYFISQRQLLKAVNKNTIFFLLHHMIIYIYISWWLLSGLPEDSFFISYYTEMLGGRYSFP